VSVKITSKPEPLVPDSSHCEDLVDFVRWAVAQLQLPFREQEGQAALTLPEEDRSAFDDQHELQLALDGRNRDGLEPISLNSRFGKWLLDKLHSLQPAVHARPKEQPAAVNALADRLFSAYQVTGGNIHLGGCQLTDFPFLRLSYAAEEASHTTIKHLYVAHDGSSVSDDLVSDLGLDKVEPITKAPPRIEEASLSALIAAGRRVAAQAANSRELQTAVAEPLLTTIVWVKQASGKLYFEIGESSAVLPFSGWAKLLKPKPFVTEYSRTSTFHLAATDDGRIDAYEQITACELSGERVLLQDLVQCSVTGKRVKKEFTEICPVSGKPTLKDEFDVCPLCQQRVSKAVLTDNACLGCRGLEKIAKDDPRLVWILGEHTGLDRWKHWQLAETLDVYIVQASSLLKRLLVVVDKETLVVRHVATAGRFSSIWTPATESVREELLL